MHRLFLPVHLKNHAPQPKTPGTILGVSDGNRVPLSNTSKLTYLQLICVRAPDNVGIHSGISRQSPLVVDFDIGWKISRAHKTIRKTGIL